MSINWEGLKCPQKSKLLMCMAASTAVALGSAGTAVGADPIFNQIKILNSGMTAPNPLQIQEQKTRLTRFVERLRTELVVDNLGDANIACDRCGELVEAEAIEGKVVPPDPLISLTFVLLRNGSELDAPLRNVSQLEAFARSYDFIQASELGTVLFTMQINGETAGECGLLKRATWPPDVKTGQCAFRRAVATRCTGVSCDLCIVP